MDKPINTFDGGLFEDVRASAIPRDTTYQPKICDPVWFCNENTADSKTSERCVLSQADYLYYQKKWDEAILLYQKAMPENMNRNTSLLIRIILESLSRCYLHKGDTECALKWAVKLLQHSQSSEHKVVAHDLLSRIHKKAGKSSKEAEHLAFCLLRQPLNGFHWMQLGHSYVYEAEGVGRVQLHATRSEKLECDQPERRIPSPTLRSRNHLIQGDKIRENDEGDVSLQERLETDLKNVKLNDTLSVTHSKPVIISSIGKAVNGKIEEERDQNFERIQNESKIHKGAFQMGNEVLESNQSTDVVVNGSRHHLNFRERNKGGSDIVKNVSIEEEEGIITGEEQGGSSTEHPNTNSCAINQDAESDINSKRFALICYIRARILFKPTAQSSASLCNIRNSKLLVEVEQSIQHLGLAKDYIAEVENLCWKRQFGIAKGEDLEKTLNSIDSSENSLQSNFEKYWFTNILDHAACTTKE